MGGEHPSGALFLKRMMYGLKHAPSKVGDNSRLNPKLPGASASLAEARNFKVGQERKL